MSSSGGLHSLATIIKRLEAATSRLEDLAIAGSGASHAASTAHASPGAGGAMSVAAPPPPPPPPPMMDETPNSVEAFDENVVKGKLIPFIELTKSFASPLVVDQISHVERVFAGLRKILLTAASCSKPDQKAFAALQEPVANEVSAVMAFPDNNRKERVWYNHLMVISEGIPSVGWIGVEPKPGPHIAQMKESADFYGNKVINQFKSTEPKHVEWVRAWTAVLEEQRKYVMEFHTTGLAWNPKGVPVSQFSGGAIASSGAPPPPPPPPPIDTGVAAGAPTAGIGAVFAELNKGSEITKGLRKVDKSEMTHKNPELRVTSAVPTATSPTGTKPARPSKPASLSHKKPKPPKMALEGTKWIIEYYENESGIMVKDTEINQTVNLFGCKSTTVQIKGKINAVTLVNCTKTSVLVDSVVSSISVTNSPSFAIQVTGNAPTIQLDSTDSGQIYLSKSCLDAEITTAKCSSINVSLPVEGEEDGVFVERAVPEMMRTVIQNGKLVTTIVEHSC